MILFAALLLAPPTQVTVPMTVEGNVPVIELDFPTPDGKARRAKFIVDTGGGAFVIGAKLMHDIGAKPEPSSGEEEPEQFVKLLPPTVRLGDFTLDLKGIPVAGIPTLTRPLSRNDAEGLFPGRLLKRYEAVFDYPHATFTLALPHVLSHRGLPIKTPIAPGSGFPRIEAEVGGKTYGFLLDTGGSFTMVSAAQLDAWRKETPSLPRSTGAVGFANMFGGPTENTATLSRLPTVMLGPFKAEHLACVSRPVNTYERFMSQLMTGPIVGALAGNLLRQFRIDIDYADETTYVERVATTKETALTTVGLVLKGRPSGELDVTGISDGASPETKAGVLAGDQLLSVDGVAMTGKTLAAAATVLAGDPGKAKRLTLLRDGKTVDAKVTVADVLPLVKR